MFPPLSRRHTPTCPPWREFGREQPWAFARLNAVARASCQRRQQQPHKKQDPLSWPRGGRRGCRVARPAEHAVSVEAVQIALLFHRSAHPESDGRCGSLLRWHLATMLWTRSDRPARSTAVHQCQSDWRKCAHDGSISIIHEKRATPLRRVPARWCLRRRWTVRTLSLLSPDPPSNRFCTRQEAPCIRATRARFRAESCAS